MNWKYWFLLGFLASIFDIGAVSQDLSSLRNLKYQHDGSEALLHSKEVPDKVSSVFERSVGAVLLVRIDPCPKKKAPCYHVMSSATAFSVMDHGVLTSFHLLEGRVKVSPNDGKITFSDRKGRSKLILRLLFGGVLYEGDFVNKVRRDGVDLALIKVQDPNATFDAPPVSFARHTLTPGINRLYATGFYYGCEEATWLDENIYCLTPGIATFLFLSNLI